MTTIQAKVNPRLLSKANRLFTGTLQGRIIEILQNARRAGAKHVVITNHDGTVTVRDDGLGIEDFAKLLDLGASGWNEKLEASEDPAGVGIFSLSPRRLTVRSQVHRAIIAGAGWTGAPVEVTSDPHPLPAFKSAIRAGVGTELSFEDEPWGRELVNSQAVFSGLEVTVDGQPCLQERFITGEAALYTDLGCRIRIVAEDQLSASHQAAIRNDRSHRNVLVNFHGQVVGFDYFPINDPRLAFLVDLTGQPTAIRLMLPARTCLVENEAFDQLKAVLEVEAFKYIQRQGSHRLVYKEYLRAKELGVELPESQPVYRVGLICNDMSPEPAPVNMPKGHPLKRCYRLADSEDGNESDEANVHLLAALGKFKEPFVPVEISAHYDGYSWAKLPTVRQVKITAGKVLHKHWIGTGMLFCVDSLAVEAHCSDGKVFSSSVCIAVKPWEDPKTWRSEDEVYVTPESRQELSDEHIWYHLGGFSDEGDTYDTQAYQFRQDLSEFWLGLLGPDEPLRDKLVQCLSELKKGWKKVTILPQGQVTISLADGQEKTIVPTKEAQASEVPS